MVGECATDLLVVGGGLGGVSAALTACRLGLHVVMSEDSEWLGGQLTSQGVPFDDHLWIENPQYASPSYHRLRRGIRDYYRRNYRLRDVAAADNCLNPGMGLVSQLCHEPRVGVAAIEEMLAPYVAASRLRILRGHVPVEVTIEGDVVESVTLRDKASSMELSVAPEFVVDATETGDVLELADVEHIIGAESREETGELHALSISDPLDQQAITWCYALDYRPGENHVIDQPAGYSYWRYHISEIWPGPQLSWTDVHPQTLAPRTRPIFIGPTDEPELMDLWHYRRILARTQFEQGVMDSDVTLVNWPQIDYWESPIVGVSEEQRSRALDRCRELSRSFLYWMQTEAPRLDGGLGYPGLRLRPDVTDTVDGLAKKPYIRESRRIRSVFAVREEHIGVEMRGRKVGSEIFHDSVGIGSYRIDLHPSTAGRTYVDLDCYPFQIPLGALLPIRVDNILPGCKNIGTTHITNGAYRLHPVEWSIGEAVGALVAVSLSSSVPPRKIWEDDGRLDDYQRTLRETLGIPLFWPDYMRCLSYDRLFESVAPWHSIVANRPRR